jgi:two-component system nitrogen regulation sensor histidine kinase NtrY
VSHLCHIGVAFLQHRTGVQYLPQGLARRAMTAISDTSSPETAIKPLRVDAETFLGNKWLNWTGIFLVALTVLFGLGTYLYLTGLTPFDPRPETARHLLYGNAVLLSLMASLIIWQLSKLLTARMRKVPGSGLHIRIVALLSVFSVLPAIIVAAFATVTLNRGLDTWLSGQTQSIVDSAEAVADAYIKENLEVARSDAAFIANELNQRAEEFKSDREKVISRIGTYGAVRGLSGLFVMNPTTKEIAISATANKLVRFRPPEPEDIAQATTGEMVVRQPDNGSNVIRALVKLEKIDGYYLYLYRLVNPEVIKQLAKARDQRREFDNLIEQRTSLQLNFAALYAGLAFIFLLSAIWLGLLFSNRLVQPIVALVSAARQVSAGELDTKVAVTNTTGDMATLGATFNQMTERLSSQRAELTSTNAQLDERRRFMEAVLGGVSAGVLGLDADGTITLCNKSALEHLDLEEADVTGHNIAEVLPEVNSIYQIAKSRADGYADGAVLRRVGDQERSFMTGVTTERGENGVDGYVVTFDDTTELVSAQRNSAWADIARRIAHEIKNPLTPIQLSAERLRRKYADQITTDRKIFDQCTDTIVRQVGDIGRMVDEFSSFARMPSAQLELHNLTTVVREALVLQKASDETLNFETSFPKQPVKLMIDRRLVEQAVTNLVKNARESIEARLQDAPDTPGAIQVSIEKKKATVIVAICDNGIGLPKENRSRLAEPYMTTREKGTGLGLAIVTRIMEEHGGRLILSDAPRSFHDGRGARVILEFPDLDMTSQPEHPGADAKDADGRKLSRGSDNGS